MPFSHRHCLDIEDRVKNNKIDMASLQLSPTSHSVEKTEIKQTRANGYTFKKLFWIQC